MIAQLRGTIIQKELRSVIIDVNGVGYRAFVSSDTLASLPSSGEQKVLLHTYLAVRENALDLYGFSTTDELNFFELLIGISGIGPKSALSILSAASLDTLTSAVGAGNPALLANISGIGKKNAEKIILELKGKVLVSEEDQSSHLRGENDAIDALKSLGYSQKEARDALGKVSKDISDISEKVKQALRILGGKE